MERCPQCRARLKGKTVCGRCETDLDIVQTVEATADILARKAVKSLLADDFPAAAKLAATAWKLQASPFHRALAGFIEKKYQDDLSDHARQSDHVEELIF